MNKGKESHVVTSIKGFIKGLLGRCDHQFGWPQKGVETCTVCGSNRACVVEFPVNPRFDVPPWKPQPKEGESRERVVAIGRKRGKANG
jgi:hypothetical protein